MDYSALILYAAGQLGHTAIVLEDLALAQV